MEAQRVTTYLKRVINRGASPRLPWTPSSSKLGYALFTLGVALVLGGSLAPYFRLQALLPPIGSVFCAVALLLLAKCAHTDLVKALTTMVALVLLGCSLIWLVVGVVLFTIQLA